MNKWAAEKKRGNLTLTDTVHKSETDRFFKQCLNASSYAIN